MRVHGSLPLLGRKQSVPDPGWAELRTAVLVCSLPEHTIVEIFLWLYMGSCGCHSPCMAGSISSPALGASMFVLEVESPGTPAIGQGWAQAPSDLSSIPLLIGTGQRVAIATLCREGGTAPLAVGRDANTPLHATYRQPGNRVAKSAQGQGMEDIHICTQILGGSYHTK